MSDFTVVQRGTDSSGRPIKATRAFWTVWDRCCDELGFTPTIVQGGWQAGGGASASATTHEGDAFDLRLWDRTAAERDRMIHVFRGHAIAYWERYESQNFDLHAHMIPGPWAKPSPGALQQWQQYLKGTDGLYYAGPDYHYRPSPLVTTPPAPKGLVMDKEVKAAFDALKADVADVRTAVSELRKKEAQRFAKTIREQRAAGRDLDAILADLESADA